MTEAGQTLQLTDATGCGAQTTIGLCQPFSPRVAVGFDVVFRMRQGEQASFALED